MENISFYYDSHEFEPSIIMIDENKKEAYIISEYDLKSINKIDFPDKKDLNKIIKKSKKDDYDGSLNSLKFIIEDISILENLANSTDRNFYINSINNLMTVQYISKPQEILIERIWERFENQSSITAQKYIKLYNDIKTYINNLNEKDVIQLLNDTNSLSDKEYFYYIIDKIDYNKKDINEKHFSF